MPTSWDAASPSTAPGDHGARRGTIREVLGAFGKLGVTAFGGPIAHLGFFRAEFVDRRRWMSDEQYANLVTLCQFLPGPASSQVGFAIGFHRAGPLGALAAFLAFTLPSAVLLVAFALGASAIEGPVGNGLLTGLKIVAAAIVAHAVLGMARSLAPDRQRSAILVVAAASALLVAGTLGQLAAIAVGILGGIAFCRGREESLDSPLRFSIRRRTGVACLVAFALLLVGLPITVTLTADPTLTLFDAMYRSGALVFGGGHVVLPLLQAETVDTGWIGSNDFLAGYGAAQAVPGPLFTFAGYLGALSSVGPAGVAGAAVALVGIFLPGFLLLLGALPFWNTLQAHRLSRAAMRGANAAVVGILAAALYDPVITSSITGPASLVLALVCFTLLAVWKIPAWAVVIVGALGGLAISLVA